MGKSRSKAKECIDILEEQYGLPEAREIDPVDLLVATILSQNTTDTNSLRAFGRLKSSYPDHEALLSASVSDIEEKIRAGGLSEMKAHRIKDSVAKIKADAGSISLSFLKGMEIQTAKEYLLSLPGVGPKTAAVVLLFAFRLPIMPVDTHVFRVSKRLGLVLEDASIEAAQSKLEKITPPSKYMSLHINLIRHGRRICKARKPEHSDCALRKICDCYSKATRLKL
jgi:endonuclease-3